MIMYQNEYYIRTDESILSHLNCNWIFKYTTVQTCYLLHYCIVETINVVISNHVALHVYVYVYQMSKQFKLHVNVHVIK